MRRVNIYRRSELETFLLLSLRLAESCSRYDYDILKKIYNKYGLEFIYNFGKREGILPFVAHVLIKVNEDYDFWKKIHAYYENRNKRIIEVLDNIFLRFKSHKINAFLYENFGVLLSTKSCIGCFSSNDVDLFAPIEQRQEIINILKQIGYEPQIRRWDVPDIRLEFYNNTNPDEGIWINIMWVPLARKFIPAFPDIDGRQFLKGAINVLNSNIMVPEPTDLLFLCSLHSSIHGYIRSPGMRLYIDIDRMSRHPLINWDKYINLAKVYQVKRRTALSLMFAMDFWGTPIPNKVKESLGFESFYVRSIYQFLAKHSFLTSNNQKLKKVESIMLEGMLHDEGLLFGIWKDLFPSKDWLVKRYNIKSDFLVPVAIIRRMWDLLRGINQ